MRSPLPLLFVLALAAATPALAQNPVQIGHVQNGANCTRCNLFQAALSNMTLKGKTYAGSRLRQADLSLSIMNHTDFAGTDMRDVNAYGALFTGANFARANLTHASFVGTYLEGANFRGATLVGTNFSGAEMDRAVGLTQRQLDQACGDRSTRLPPGLGLRACH